MDAPGAIEDSELETIEVIDLDAQSRDDDPIYEDSDESSYDNVPEEVVVIETASVSVETAAIDLPENYDSSATEPVEVIELELVEDEADPKANEKSNDKTDAVVDDKTRPIELPAKTDNELF